MKYDPARHHRRSIRLKGYDYTTAGAYYITMVCHNREHLFGKIVNGEMRLNAYGELVRFTWDDLVHHIPNIELDAFVIMPNHVHGIIVIVGTASVVGAGSEPAPSEHKPYAISEIVRQFKTFSARRINDLRGTRSTSVWQRNYYEHIVRDQRDLERIREYIFNNPLNWESDTENVL